MDKIHWLLDELSDGQFITVLKCDVKPVDAGLDQIQGYIYGTQPVAQLHLVCEEVYLRDWCRKLMPKEVAANLLGVSKVNGGSDYSPDSGGMDQSNIARGRSRWPGWRSVLILHNWDFFQSVLKA